MSQHSDPKFIKANDFLLDSGFYSQLIKINGVQKAIDKANIRKRTRPHVQTDMAQIRASAEIIFGDENSYVNVSCDNSKYGLKEICSDIEKYAETKLIINTSKDKYCAYVQFKSTNQWVCIDSSGFLNIVANNPATSGLCDGQTFTCSH